MPDLQTRTDRFNLQALYETSRLLSSSLDLQFVLNNLLLTAMSKLFVTRGVAMVYRPDSETYRVTVSKGLSALNVDDVIDVGEPSRILQQDDAVPDTLAEQGIEIVLPIAFAERDIGLLGLGPKVTKQAFDDAEIEFILSLVNMSSSAVHNSLVAEELRTTNRSLDNKIQQLNTLFDLSQEFNAALERDRVIRLLQFALMGQMLVGKHLFLLRSAGPDDEPPTFTIAASKSVQRPKLTREFMDSICGLDKARVLTEEDDDAATWCGLRETGIQLLVPLHHKNDTCGVLCLGPKMTGQPYSEDDFEFLHALGNLAFVSIQNADLVEQQIEKERLEKEMRLAREIQQGLLPRNTPVVDGIELASLAIPSRHVGGDYFDLVKLEKGRLLTAIADVTGKGVPASLLMANLQACLHMCVPLEVSLEEGTGYMNRVICQNTSYDKFITFAQGIYDPTDGRFDYVNAGHNPPTIVRADGTVEYLEKGGLLLGVMNLPYERGTVYLKPGDVLALFTDGVTEAMSPDEEEYGEPRLEAQLAQYRHKSAEDILDLVHADIKAFTEDPPFLSDDLTMIVLKVT
ncbi:MAG: PP2C family protein-serine/threonine phosphatase [Rhodothermales bacterium]